MAHHSTTDQVELIHRRIGATAGVNQLTVTLHGAQAAAQAFDQFFVIINAQLSGQLLAVGRRAALL